MHSECSAGTRLIISSAGGGVAPEKYPLRPLAAHIRRKRGAHLSRTLDLPDWREFLYPHKVKTVPGKESLQWHDVCCAGAAAIWGGKHDNTLPSGRHNCGRLTRRSHISACSAARWCDYI